MAYAAVGYSTVNPLQGRFTSLAQVFGAMMNIVLGVGVSLTVIYLILGGIKYVMSQGDPKNTQVAREWLTNAVIGFIVVVGAFAIRQVVGNLLGGSAGNVQINDITP